MKVTNRKRIRNESKVKNESEVKNESIKIRATKEQKEKLRYLSELNKESMSSYLLRKGLEDNTNIYDSILDKVDICNVLNEIYHRLMVSGCRNMEQEVKAVFQMALEKYRKGVL